MKAKRTARKVVFVLNDSDEMLKELSSFCESFGVRVVTSQCVGEAVKLARELAATGAAVLAFVDLMLPLSLSDLNPLRKTIEERRRKIQGCLADGAGREQRLIEARKEFEALDRQTEALIDAEGGLTFLRECSPWIQEWRIVIMSAASFECISKSRETGVSLQKVLRVPVSSDELESVVVEFLRGE
ncbi:MAG: hypothetical protein WCS99_19680 [Limisphaerales bacterium]